MGLRYELTDAEQAELEAVLGDHVVSVARDCAGETEIALKASELPKVVSVLRNEASLSFTGFVDLCGVDLLGQKPRFESVVHLYSFESGHRVRLRVKVPDETMTVPTLTGFWPAANWQEREAFDMYGIRYQGHPNLERILSPLGTQDFPQRKDFPLRGHREEEW